MPQDVKTSFSEEKKKLKEMSFKEKRWYIWEYYKVPIVAGVIILAVLGSLINTWFINPPKKPVLFIAWSGGVFWEELLMDFADALSEGIDHDPDREEVVVSSFMASDDPQVAMVNFQRMVAMLTAGEIDIMILGRDDVLGHAEAEFISPLDDILTEVKLRDPIIYESVMDKILLANKPDFSDQNQIDDTQAQAMHAFGIDLSGNEFLTNIGFYEQELYFTVAITSGQTENVIRALMMIYGY